MLQDLCLLIKQKEKVTLIVLNLSITNEPENKFPFIRNFAHFKNKTKCYWNAKVWLSQDSFGFTISTVGCKDSPTKQITIPQMARS